ncbi:MULTISPECIES: TetR/AcrR family transcriptional regulator [unclassified Rathayibacter]|uniref:TetR/AcrR family transcriptional regulator n=1 Tax=unclassified Rathayibacter TaxID=2609250 RepID=UPI000F4C2F8D|nr:MULTISPECIES: TetR/AcrR family transcriptional regulator [unclassified Rathayibacter]ROP44364.1 TetR family transcriptional regulator [Rathayibacter sp. PhB186]ROQ52615.1 TetR family transcriptional regulator [Rathayibacter sp. PhB152]ROS46968.1 TetR family transcriptional regulator [Rathayibacter sp. PhB185]
MTSPASSAPGRRERNKQQKLDRITAAADELFSRRGVDDVTTQQIADAADIGTGTLFLYARNKAELLLLVQNTHYAQAIEVGVRASAAASCPLDAVMALVEPVVECNRRQIENGRTYLREIVFGDAEEPHHRVGLELMQRVDTAYADILQRDGRLTAEDAALLARTISATAFVSLASPMHVHSTNQEICDDIREQMRVVLRT